MGVVGWSVTAVSHTTNSFFKSFFNYWYGIFLNLILEILVLALKILLIFFIKIAGTWNM